FMLNTHSFHPFNLEAKVLQSLLCDLVELVCVNLAHEVRAISLGLQKAYDGILSTS
ncbi:hypothetical protein L9F63_019666, partial [Diploptera punctata]